MPAGFLILCALGALILTGCGGGGSGSDDNSSSGPVLTGAIAVPTDTAIDGDVNDAMAPFEPNDTVSTAQFIPNPVTLGGYANFPAEGDEGRSKASGDRFDLYQVALAANQTISLFVGGDGIVNDLDLLLLDLTGNQVLDSGGAPILSRGQTPFESMTVQVAGTYLILVEAFAGGSNYVLVIGQQIASTGTPATAKEGDYVPGEVIVQFKDPPKQGAKTTLAAREQSLGLTAMASAGEGPTLMRFANMQDRAATFTALGARTLMADKHVIRHRDARSALAFDTVRMAKVLRRRADVVSADLNYIRRSQLTPNDNRFPFQWHYPQTNLPSAWDNVPGTSNVIVAVIDTGVVSTHPDLQNQLVAGYDFISNPDNAADGNGIDPDPSDPGDGTGTRPDSFHGTHVAGTVAARTNNNIGVAGVAWNSKIMPLRVLGPLGATDADTIQAIRFAARLSNASGTLPAGRADVINMSLAGPGFSQTFQDTITAARAQGVTVVAAAGNQASSALAYPAAFDGAISVSAVDINKAPTPYSNFGSTVDVAAPGGNSPDLNGDGNPDGVLSTWATKVSGVTRAEYAFLQGTSMASPHVAGVVALMKSVNTALTPQDIDNLLAAGELTDDLGPAGRDDQFGFGLVDAFKAVSAAIVATGGAPPSLTPSLNLTPSALNLGRTLTELTLNAGTSTGVVTVAAPTDDAVWLTVSASSVDANGLGDYQVTVDRSGLADGIYSATITFASSANTVRVPLIMQVGGNVSSTGNAGFHYVLLVDPETRNTVTQFEAAVQNGRYEFRFTGVPAGTYQIIAGTDSNNNRLICDPGEACGAYPTLDQPSAITVDGDRSGLDFDTGFQFGLSSTARGAAGHSLRRSLPQVRE